MAAAPPPTVARLGSGGHPLLILDDVTGDVDALVETAAALGPFPPAAGNAYPGLRRPIRSADTAAAAYVRGLLRAVVPFVDAAFDVDGFDLLDASFSMVTRSPAVLAPVQRAPHFDSTDPLYLAVLHYVSGTEGSGTAFFRQRATGIERVTDTNRIAFVAAATRESAGWTGYVDASSASFERIGLAEGRRDRVLVYQGSLLHSGAIPPDLSFSDDPRRGRLTGNFFVRGRPRRQA